MLEVHPPETGLVKKRRGERTYGDGFFVGETVGFVEVGGGGTGSASRAEGDDVPAI